MAAVTKGAFCLQLLWSLAPLLVRSPGVAPLALRGRHPEAEWARHSKLSSAAAVAHGHSHACVSETVQGPRLPSSSLESSSGQLHVSGLLTVGSRLGTELQSGFSRARGMGSFYKIPNISVLFLRSHIF